MFFATTTQPQLRRQAYANAGRTLERFVDDALRSTANKSCAYTQDETAFTLSLDVPGVAKEQLSIGIEGAVVRIDSLADAPRKVKADSGQSAATWQERAARCSIPEA